MRHLLIGAAAALVLLGGTWWRAWTGSARRRGQPDPELPVEEMLSASGRYKAVVFAHDETGVLRVEVFRRFVDDETGPYWIASSRPSFVDRGALRSVVEEKLRAF